LTLQDKMLHLDKMLNR